MTQPTKITIDNIEYVRAAPATDANWVIIRSADAGVFFGELQTKNDSEVLLSQARRVWYWAGAATLSDLAMDGTTKGSQCKFSQALPVITVLNVCEIIPMTAKAIESMNNVAVWSVK